jgi:hypothetical protein
VLLGASADDLAAALALVRRHGLRGLAAGAPFPGDAAARSLEHAHQLRKRVRSS